MGKHEKRIYPSVRKRWRDQSFRRQGGVNWKSPRCKINVKKVLFMTRVRCHFCSLVQAAVEGVASMTFIPTWMQAKQCVQKPMSSLDCR